MNPPTEEMVSTVCVDCGQSFRYEPILVFGRDLAAGLNLHCETCQSRREAELQRALQERALRERSDLVRATLPPELLPLRLDPLGTDIRRPEFNAKMWELVKKWRPGPHGDWIALVGPAGECKTRCLALLADKIIMQGNRLTWTSAMRLHSEATMNLRSRERHIQQVAREHLADCLTMPWLIIDDLGNNEWSPAFESQLFTILDHRKNHRLPIAYSSNAHPEEFFPCITSVNPAALIGRLLDRTTIFEFSPHPHLPLP